MVEKYWELIVAEKETIEATGKIKTHMIVSIFSSRTSFYDFQLRRPLTVTECGNCWAITESPLYLQWAVGASYDGADNIMYHSQTGRGHSNSKVRIFRSKNFQKKRFSDVNIIQARKKRLQPHKVQQQL